MGVVRVWRRVGASAAAVCGGLHAAGYERMDA